MKTFKFLMPFLLVALAVTGCDTDDLRNDVDELKNRVESLEAQISAINENMNVLQVLIDGNKTIQSCQYDETTRQYKLVLSDGQELTLSQGADGVANVPTIIIDETDNTWVVNGTDTGVKATGTDAATPQFSVSAEGYWMVDYDGEGGEAPVNVKDTEGNNVQAKPSDSGETQGDTFFTAVTVENGYLKVTLRADGKSYLLPIVEGLVAEIVTTDLEGFKDGVLTVGYGATVEIPVKVTGESYFVTAPAGWIAQLSEPSDGSAIITLTAPAQSAAASRASADNTTDLTLQVNKGAAWAIDQIKVEGKVVITSYYELFDEGETLTFGEYQLKKSGWTTSEEFVIKQVTENENINKAGIYFVKPGVTVTWTGDGKLPIANTFIIGDDSSKRTSVLAFGSNNFIQLDGGAEGKGTVMCENIILNARESNYSLNIGNKVEKLIFDNCIINLSEKAFYYAGTNNDIGQIIFENSIVNITKCTSQIFNAGGKVEGTLNVKLVNNVFYANPLSTRNAIFNFPKAVGENGSVEIKNNTFINTAAGSNGIVSAGKLKTIDIQNNLFYQDSYVAYQGVIKLGNDTNQEALPSGVEGTVLNNICNAEKDVITQTYKVFSTSNKVFDGSEQITRGAKDMFDVCNFETLTFTPKPEYAEYGAKFE